METTLPPRTCQSWIGILAAALVLAPAMAAEASDKPFVWARSNDALTLDPHAVNEGTTHALNHHIYEPLIIRDHTGKLEAALATDWRQTIDPLVWHFTLRPGVVFHDGSKLTVEDVVFSVKRAMSPTSDLRSRLQGVRAVKRLDSDKIEIRTFARDPLLPIQLTDIYILSRAWAEKHDVAKPQNYSAGEKTYAMSNANGTGPYRLVTREIGKATRLTRHDAYWGWAGDDERRIRDIVYQPIPDGRERITALLDGSVDFVQDVPVGEIETLGQAPNVDMKVGPENRVIFLGLSVAKTYDGQPNPLTNPDLRRAIAMAIDRRAIQRDIMRGQSIPTAVLAPPGINGFPTDLDVIAPPDPDGARKLIANTDTRWKLTLDCPNNRYVNDAAICGAIAEQLKNAGLKIDVQLRPKTQHFKKVRGGGSQFFLLGWGVPTFDSAYIFSNLVHTRQANLGTWNGTGFSDPALDKQIVELSQMVNNSGRSKSLAAIWQRLAETRIYIPIHVQTLLYAMKDRYQINVDISNTPKLKHAVVGPASE